MEEQYKKFYKVVKANAVAFSRRGFKLFKNERCFGYKDPGRYGYMWATWSSDGTGSILVDSLYTKYQEYKTFSGWLKRTEKNLKRA